MGRSLQLRHAKPNVLVVEDVDDVREMYVEYLTYLGLNAEGAINGRDAVRKAITQQRALIVMDLAMPVLDGWEAIRILKADPRTRSIPIVVLTGQAQPELLERARALGAAEVVVKPCLPAQLGSVVMNAIASKEPAKPASTPATRGFGASR